MEKTTDEAKKEKLRQAIMITVKANNVHNADEVWLGLVFRSELELLKIANALHINTKDL